MDQTTLTLFESAATSNNIYDASLSSIKQTATAANFGKIAYSSTLGLWVSVGANGNVAVSKDNITWEFFSIVFGVELTGVAFANGLFVAVGNISTVFTSINGYDWTQRTFPVASLTLTEVVYNNGLWVVSCNTGSQQIFTSTDAITWTLKWSTTAGFQSTLKYYPLTYYATSIWANIIGGQVATSTDGITWTLRPISTDVIFSHVHYTGSLWIAAGALVTNANSIVLAYSTDGVAWSTPNTISTTTRTLILTSNGNNVLIGTAANNIWVSSNNGFTGTFVATGQAGGTTSLTYGNSRWVLTSGGSGDVMVSTTGGVTWTKTVASGFGVTSVMIYANNLFVAAIGSTIKTSPDATTWTTQTTTGSGGILDIKFFDGKFVAVGSSGSIRTSATGTGTWSTRTSPTAGSISRVSFGNGLWVGVGVGIIVTSSDAVTWSLTSLASNYNHVEYNNGAWVAYGSSNTIIRSTTGTGWTFVKRDLQQPRSIGFGNNTWTAVGGAGEITTSLDLNNWTFRTSNTANQLNNVVYKNNQWMAVGNSGTVLQSTDATTWNVRTNAASQTTQNLQHIDFGNGVWAASGSGSGMITSSDTTTWQLRNLPKTSNLAGIVYSSGSNWTTSGSWGLIQTSDNSGASWTQRTSFVGTTPLPSLYSVDYGSTLANPLFVAVGASGCILSSPDGTTWTTRSSSGSTLNKVVFANNTFVVVGDGGTIRTSPDGVAWTTRTSGTTQALIDVAYGTHNNTWVVVGTGGIIITATATDLATWSAATSGFSAPINCIKYANGIFVLGASSAAQNLRYSSTGTGTWTAVANSTSFLAGSSGHQLGQSVFDIDYIDGKFFNLGGWPCSSANGINWTYLGNAGPRGSGTSVDYLVLSLTNFMKNVNNKLIATAVNGTKPIFISKNGLNWIRTTDLKQRFSGIRDIAYGNGKYVTVGDRVGLGGYIGCSTI
jgi:hypothetical protein